jgi:hypothetical protein
MPAEIRPRNEAAERLHRLMGVGKSDSIDLRLALLAAALAEERRLVVAQIRERFVNVVDPCHECDNSGHVYAILDEVEADRPDDPISDARQPEDGPPPGRWPR